MVIGGTLPHRAPAGLRRARIASPEKRTPPRRRCVACAGAPALRYQSHGQTGGCASGIRRRERDSSLGHRRKQAYGRRL